MKILSITTCFITAGLSLVQTAPAREPHGLVTLKLAWSRKLSAPRVNRPPQDEVSGPARRSDPHQDPVDTLRRSSQSPTSSLPGKYFYVYSLKIRNESGKGVSGVYWDYVASDRDTAAELNRRHIINIQEVGPGEVATLSTEYPSPPTNVVTPGGLGRDERSPFTSSAEIKCVLYADGTVWQAAGGDKDCAELRQADAQVPVRKGKRP